MMKKIIALYLIIFSIGFVNAKSDINGIENELNNYKNKNNVVISSENYKKMKKVMSEEEIDIINERFYELVENCDEIVAIDSKIIETRRILNNNQNIILERELETSEYNDLIKSGSIFIDSDQYATSYKRVVLIARKTGNRYFLNIHNYWLKVPVTKSFDVIGLRLSGSITKYNSTAQGTQFYDIPSGANVGEVNYQYTSNNFELLSNGIGLSQNLVNGNYVYENTMEVQISCTGQVYIYGTYQHAQSDLSLNDSKSYTISSAGLGGVLLFSTSTISNKYDGMQGVNISFTC